MTEGLPNGKPFPATTVSWDKFPTVDLDQRSQGALRGALEQLLRPALVSVAKQD